MFIFMFFVPNNELFSTIFEEFTSINSSLISIILLIILSFIFYISINFIYKNISLIFNIITTIFISYVFLISIYIFITNFESKKYINIPIIDINLSVKPNFINNFSLASKYIEISNYFKPVTLVNGTNSNSILLAGETESLLYCYDINDFNNLINKRYFINDGNHTINKFISNVCKGVDNNSTSIFKMDLIKFYDLNETNFDKLAIFRNSVRITQKGNTQILDFCQNQNKPTKIKKSENNNSKNSTSQKVNINNNLVRKEENLYHLKYKQSIYEYNKEWQKE